MALPVLQDERNQSFSIDQNTALAARHHHCPSGKGRRSNNHSP
jgi:hypothetical protein